MPSLFKRRSVEDEIPEVAAAQPDESEQAESAQGDSGRPKRRTPSKRELGLETRKRPPTDARRRSEPPPSNMKEARAKAREKAKEDRAQRRAAMMAGDDRYLLGRDKGPERALVRDIVDRRFTVGTWFFGGALLVLIGSSAAMPPLVQSISNFLWALLAVGTLVDSILLGREVRKKMAERFPKSTQKMTSLYLYAAMRGLTFRRLRIPKPRVKIGDKI